MVMPAVTGPLRLNKPTSAIGVKAADTAAIRRRRGAGHANWASEAARGFIHWSNRSPASVPASTMIMSSRYHDSYSHAAGVADQTFCTQPGEVDASLAAAITAMMPSRSWGRVQIGRAHV